jgi:hypothetical protein
MSVRDVALTEHLTRGDLANNLGGFNRAMGFGKGYTGLQETASGAGFIIPDIGEAKMLEVYGTTHPNFAEVAARQPYTDTTTALGFDIGESRMIEVYGTTNPRFAEIAARQPYLYTDTTTALGFDIGESRMIEVYGTTNPRFAEIAARQPYLDATVKLGFDVGDARLIDAYGTTSPHFTNDLMKQQTLDYRSSVLSSQPLVDIVTRKYNEPMPREAPWEHEEHLAGNRKANEDWLKATLKPEPIMQMQEAPPTKISKPDREATPTPSIFAWNEIKAGEIVPYSSSITRAATGKSIANPYDEIIRTMVEHGELHPAYLEGISSENSLEPMTAMERDTRWMLSRADAADLEKRGFTNKNGFLSKLFPDTGVDTSIANTAVESMSMFGSIAAARAVDQSASMGMSNYMSMIIGSAKSTTKEVASARTFSDVMSFSIEDIIGKTDVNAKSDVNSEATTKGGTSSTWYTEPFPPVTPIIGLPSGGSGGGGGGGSPIGRGRLKRELFTYQPVNVRGLLGMPKMKQPRRKK